MLQYIKKAVAVDASHYVQYGKLVTGMCNSRSCYTNGNTVPHIHTAHDNQLVTLEVGDYIVSDMDRIYFHICKPDVFEATYTPVVGQTISKDLLGQTISKELL